MTRTLGQSIARFASAASAGTIPEEVRRAARMHIVDSIGVSIAGASPAEESGRAAAKLAEGWRSPDGSTMLGAGARARPELAALFNGALAQALEMDDKHGSSLARPGSTIVPAVLALGEASGRSVGEAIASTVVGYEVMIRLGFVAAERFLERGYHTSSLLGPFGAAAAAGNLLGDGAGTIADALGICGTFASGIQEATRTGSTSKILHGGWGAHAGILAADLARSGITGPQSVFEGKFGFFETHLTPISGDLRFDLGSAGLGERWYLPETAFKPYPCCQLLHAFIDAATEIRRELETQGIAPESITGVLCRLAEPGLTLVSEPRSSKMAPATPHEARFSIYYTTAAALLRGHVGLETFSPRSLRDEGVLELAGRIEAAVDPDSDYPQHCPARLTVEADGRTFARHVPFHPGSPEAALSGADVRAKFERNTRWYSGSGAEALFDRLMAFPEEAPVSEFLGTLHPADSRLRKAS